MCKALCLMLWGLNVNKACGYFRVIKSYSRIKKFIQTRAKQSRLGREHRAGINTFLKKRPKRLRFHEEVVLNWPLNSKWDFTRYSTGKNILNRNSSLK